MATTEQPKSLSETEKLAATLAALEAERERRMSAGAWSKGTRPRLMVLPALRFANSRARQKFLLFNQLRFLRRFMRLDTRSGFCVGNTACNNLAAVLDDFPIPATVFAVWHNAQLNVCHRPPLA